MNFKRAEDQVRFIKMSEIFYKRGIAVPICLKRLIETNRTLDDESLFILGKTTTEIRQKVVEMHQPLKTQKQLLNESHEQFLKQKKKNPKGKQTVGSMSAEAQKELERLSEL